MLYIHENDVYGSLPFSSSNSVSRYKHQQRSTCKSVGLFALLGHDERVTWHRTTFQVPNSPLHFSLSFSNSSCLASGSLQNSLYPIPDVLRLVLVQSSIYPTAMFNRTTKESLCRPHRDAHHAHRTSAYTGVIDASGASFDTRGSSHSPRTRLR